uniref:Secreted protein n=1 Tax=Strigamia maritima TaxID=126957 RepID=T1J3A9_STRMM
MLMGNIFCSVNLCAQLVFVAVNALTYDSTELGPAIQDGRQHEIVRIATRTRLSDRTIDYHFDGRNSR